MAIKVAAAINMDIQVRSDKSLMLKSLAYATFHSVNKSRIEVAQGLILALDIFRTTENGIYGNTDGVGTYTGELVQFRSQYTPGLEFGLWKSCNPKFVLSGQVYKSAL